MLVVLEAAGMLVNRVPSEWHLTPGGPHAYHTEYRPVRRPSRRPSRLWAAIGRGVSRIVAAIRQAHERRELVRVLSARDDRLLADIGIARDQIPEVADAAVKQGPQHATRLASPTDRVHHDAVAVDAVANDNEARIAA
jgi:uncharacterized protein YjiS (DUF1127 family)